MRKFFKKSALILVGLLFGMGLTLGTFWFTNKKKVTQTGKFLTRNIFEKSGLTKLDYELGMALAASGKFDGARRVFEELMVSDPENASYANNLGYVFAELGDLQTAKGFFDRALTKEPYCAECLNNLGSLFFRSQNLEQAKELFEKARSAKPAFVDPAINLAVIHEQQARFGTALDLYREVQPKVTDPEMKKWVGLRVLLLEDIVSAVERKLVSRK